MLDPPMEGGLPSSLSPPSLKPPSLRSSGCGVDRAGLSASVPEPGCDADAAALVVRVERVLPVRVEDLVDGSAECRDAVEPLLIVPCCGRVGRPRTQSNHLFQLCARFAAIFSARLRSKAALYRS